MVIGGDNEPGGGTRRERQSQPGGAWPWISFGIVSFSYLGLPALLMYWLVRDRGACSVLPLSPASLADLLFLCIGPGTGAAVAIATLAGAILLRDRALSWRWFRAVSMIPVWAIAARGCYLLMTAL